MISNKFKFTMFLILLSFQQLSAGKIWKWQITNLHISSSQPNLLRVALSLTALPGHQGRLGNCNLQGNISGTLLGFETANKPEVLKSYVTGYTFSLTDPCGSDNWQLNMAYDGTSGNGKNISQTPAQIADIGFYFTNPNQTASVRLNELQQTYEDNNIASVNVQVDTAARVIHLSNVGLPKAEKLPAEYRLMQNYPNPFNQSTVLQYALPQKSRVQIHIYDMQGRQVRMLDNHEHPAGIHQTAWNGKSRNNTDVPSGLYLVRFQAGGFQAVRKIMLIR